MIMSWVFIVIASLAWTWLVCRMITLVTGRPVIPGHRPVLIRFRCHQCGQRKTFLRFSKASAWMLRHYTDSRCAVLL